MLMEIESCQKKEFIKRRKYYNPTQINLMKCKCSIALRYITEPCRIQNKEELVQSLQTTGWDIYPLSGNEEALYDFLGTKYSYPNLTNGIAFDVGGGSTELISFKNGQPIDAMSFPLGCVRLRHLPIDTPECEREILSARKEYPSLNITCEELIGIGGTMRAAGKVYQALFHEELTIEVIKTTRNIR